MAEAPNESALFVSDIINHMQPQSEREREKIIYATVHHIKVPTPPRAILGSSQGWFCEGRDSQASVGKEEEENVKGTVSLKK